MKNNSLLRNAVKGALGGFGTANSRCDRDDCNGIAAWRVGARVWARGSEHRDDNCVHLRFPLVCCDACKETTTAADIVDHPGWAKIEKALRMRGKATPDRSSLKMAFEPLAMARA